MNIDEVVKQIFYYIDTYYDENKAAIVKKLIDDYVLSLNNTGSIERSKHEKASS